MLTTTLKKLKPIISFEVLIQESEQSIENHMWVTARGLELPVKSMTTSHIHNCIKCWEGRGNMRIPNDYLGGKEKWLKIFNQELITRQ